MIRHYPLYCGGKFIETSSRFEIKNSWDNSIVGSCSVAGTGELEKAIVKGLEVQEELKEMPAYEKSAILHEIANAIEANKEMFALTLSREACKTMKLAIAEVDRATAVFHISAEEAKRPPSEYIRLDWNPAGKGKEGLVKYFPVGLVAGISPFNFPLMLAVHKIAPALAAGCPIVLKPSSTTPLSTLNLAEVLDKSSLPKGSVSILPMDRVSGNKIVTDPRFKLLTFTGSPAAGWKMKTDCGKKKIVLELGGNAGAIVTASCDFERAVNRCLYGSFAYAGQVCIHTQRIYVDRSIFDKFTEQFVAGVNALKPGAPDDASSDISAMINEPNAVRVAQWVNEAVKAGATALCGAKRRGSFYEPTVLTGTTDKMNVNCKEIFGPVVNIEPYDTFEEAVARVNNSEYGLQAGVFTNDIKQMDHAFNHLEVGGVIINEVPTYRIDHMPYGGVKNSGLGREGIKYAMMDMMEPRLLVK
jgi:acyl-CoA reductase-like NAD-dependent aldehyde dehydrogenase